MNIVMMIIVVFLTIICVWLEVKSPSRSKGEVCRMIACGIIGIMILSEQAWCIIVGTICMVPYTILTLFRLWPRIFDKKTSR